MNRLLVGTEATQRESHEVTLDTEREWADPPGEGSAMAFANLVEETISRTGTKGPEAQPTILRAAWVPIFVDADEDGSVEFVLHYLFRTADGCLHAALALLEQG